MVLRVLLIINSEHKKHRTKCQKHRTFSKGNSATAAARSRGRGAVARSRDRGAAARSRDRGAAARRRDRGKANVPRVDLGSSNFGIVTCSGKPNRIICGKINPRSKYGAIRTMVVSGTVWRQAQTFFSALLLGLRIFEGVKAVYLVGTFGATSTCSTQRFGPTGKLDVTWVGWLRWRHLRCRCKCASGRTVFGL